MKHPNLCEIPDDRWVPELFRHSLAAREMLEQAWSPETAYQGITLTEADVAARAQCGISSLWFANYLERQGEEAYFVDGVINLDDYTGECVWVEAVRPAIGTFVVDLTCDQYQTIHGSRVVVSQYGSQSGSGLYTPLQRFKPDEVPHGKLRKRYAILEQNLANLSRRQRNRPWKTYL